MRIAIATIGHDGIHDELADVFSRTPTITIIDLNQESKEYHVTEIFDNEALSFKHGAGPILIKTLLDKKVDVAVGPKVGIGTEELLREKGIKFLKFREGTTVKEVIDYIIEKNL